MDTLPIHVGEKPTKMQFAATLFGIFAIAFILFLTVANAASTSDSIQTGVASASKSVYDIITAIVTPVAGVFFAWDIFKAIFGGQRGMEEAKKNLLTIILVVAGVYLAPLIVSTAASWFKPGSDSTIWSGTTVTGG